MCLLDERYTHLDENNTVTFGKGERICLDCGRRELRREVSHIGRLGQDGIRHLEDLLLKFRNLDRVLATLQPEKVTMASALFDKLEAHPVMKTAPVNELPLPRQFIEASGVVQLDAGPAARGRSRSPVREGPSRRGRDRERQDLHRRDGRHQELSGRAGADALFGPARCPCEPEVRAVHGAVREDGQDRSPDRCEPAEPSRDPEGGGPESPGPDHCRYLRGGGQHDPVRAEDEPISQRS